MSLLDGDGGYNSISSGGVFVLRPNFKPVRIRDIGDLQTSKIDVLGPEGIRTLTASISNFNAKLYAAAVRGPAGTIHKFALNNIPLYVDHSTGLRMEVGQVLNGVRPDKKELASIRLTIDAIRYIGRPDYEYILTADGPIYIGAGKNPVFLPFFVRRS